MRNLQASTVKLDGQQVVFRFLFVGFLESINTVIDLPSNPLSKGAKSDMNVVVAPLNFHKENAISIIESTPNNFMTNEIRLEVTKF